MRIGALEVNEALPDFKEPHALAVIQPWIDAGKVGSLVLTRMEKYLGTRELAKLARPGSFFDFTRYRPTMDQTGMDPRVTIPNISINYGSDPQNHDFIFLRLLEPHNIAETFVQSIVSFLKMCGIKRFCLIGSMYDLVPYTRPLLVTGNASNQVLQNALSLTSVIPSNYSGPTSILTLLGKILSETGVETCNMIVHLPSYFVMEEDFLGEKRIMDIISSFYNIGISQTDAERAALQQEQIIKLADQFLEQQPQYKLILQQLESSYDSRMKAEQPEIPLSPEVEKFLRGLNIKFKPD